MFSEGQEYVTSIETKAIAILVNLSSTKLNFPVQILLEKIKPAVAEKSEFN